MASGGRCMIRLVVRRCVRFIFSSPFKKKKGKGSSWASKIHPQVLRPLGDHGVGLLLERPWVGASWLPDRQGGRGLRTGRHVHLLHCGHLHGQLCGGLEGWGHGQRWAPGPAVCTSELHRAESGGGWEVTLEGRAAQITWSHSCHNLKCSFPKRGLCEFLRYKSLTNFRVWVS